MRLECIILYILVLSVCIFNLSRRAVVLFVFFNLKVFIELIVGPSLLVSKEYDFGWVSLVLLDMFHWTRVWGFLWRQFHFYNLLLVFISFPGLLLCDPVPWSWHMSAAGCRGLACRSSIFPKGCQEHFEVQSFSFCYSFNLSVILTQSFTHRGWSISDSDSFKMYLRFTQPRASWLIKMVSHRSSLLSSPRIIQCTCYQAGCFADYLEREENIFLIVGEKIFENWRHRQFQTAFAPEQN